MRKLICSILAGAALLVAGCANAQSSAQPVVTGYLTTSGCTSGVTTCFVQYGAGGGGGGGASVTQRASVAAVTAGTGQPLYGDSASGAVLFEPVKPGTTTTIDLSAPSALIGQDGSTIMGPSNPLNVLISAGTAVIGHVINDASSAVIGHVITDTGSTTVLGAGTALAGKFGIDQTTLGTTNATAIKDVNNVAPDFTATSPVGAMVYPGKNAAGVFTIATPETCSSGNVANATVACTLAASASKTTYITGFTMTGDGATVGLAVSCTLTNTITGTMTYTFGYPIGVAVPAVPLVVTFPFPIPASAVNTTIVASCPASGTGGTNAAISATGFQL